MAVAALTMLCLPSGWVFAEDHVARSVATIIELAEELEREGRELCIVRMPVRPEMYESKTDAHDDPMTDRHENTVSGDDAESLLEGAGIPVLNLYPDIRRESLLADIFQQDRFHFTPEADERISRILAKKLREAGVMMLPEKKKSVVFMGECFAESFARQIIASNPQDEIKILNKNGGGYLVHNYLYVFPEEYLEGTDLVVWVFTDRHFLNPNFADLDPDPAVPTDSQPRSVLARVKSTTSLKLGDEKLFDYPDALRTGIFKIVGSGEQVVGVDQILKGRQVTLNRKYREGDLLRLRLVPWQAWIRENPTMMSTFLIDDVDDFRLPRFWIEDWLIEGEEDAVQFTDVETAE